MEPVFTLQWPEFLLANQLQKLFPKSEGFSVFIPASRQEKGVDLAILRKNVSGGSRVVTIQIKASRTYTPEPPKQEKTRRLRFYTWFNRFEVPVEADFFILFGMYAPDASQTKKVSSTWYKDCSLLFTRDEMTAFMASCLTVGGKHDKMFGFGFDDERKILQTRGDKGRLFKDFTENLLSNRILLLKESLG